MDEQFYKNLIDNLYDGIYYVNRKGEINFWNKGAERITGFTSAEVMGLLCSANILRHISVDGLQLCIEGCPLKATLRDGRPRRAEAFLHHKEGHRVPISIKVTPIYKNNEIVGAVEIFSDTSSRIDILKEIEALKKEILIDPLTNIGNRRFAEISLHNRLEILKLYQVPFGVLLLDIDHFKHVNDNYGHNVGDRVLTMVAQTLSNVLRRMDVLARWGGEEFVLIIPGADRKTLHEIAERIRTFVAQSWLTVNGNKLGVTVSVGGTLVQTHDTIHNVIQRADTFMYSCKQAGRNRVCLEGELKGKLDDA